jgi:plasmid stabilization system protein ParE
MNVNWNVRWSSKAEHDIAQVLRWFQEQSATAAGDRWFIRLQRAAQRLEHDPESLPLALESESLGFELRELICGRRPGQYRVLFFIEGRTVTVLHVRHASRDETTWHDL